MRVTFALVLALNLCVAVFAAPVDGPASVGPIQLATVEPTQPSKSEAETDFWSWLPWSHPSLSPRKRAGKWNAPAPPITASLSMPSLSPTSSYSLLYEIQTSLV
ncbi:hypothetical protein BDK51DRAFT_40889 [Blyttiomyces helicus]|uniref:Uncharacterized protein n=1 Tax=Blyttiomyces helicus TaxID=388810 RepID=A0A4P9VU92_9FUNG|nr:hypothetical protein BDK51DRAFT_40889 [Blyttiomyces helicus]|eukprot:RKO83144.1 hypothetical protein BDK51DRAFT_40889 [Blyttiomyces helicus]